VQQIAAAAAVQRIVAGGDHFVGKKRGIADADAVIGVAAEFIAAVAALHRVVAGVADQDVVERAAGEGIGAAQDGVGQL
jgi:hypothetical protein